MNPLPPAYGWIDDLQPLPRMVAEARKLYGTIEARGPADNPVILGWAKELGLAKVYNHDEIPWCGLFVAIVAKRAGKALPTQPLWARSWVNFGKDGSAKPQFGDVLVFRRGEASGHVGIYIGEDYGAFHVLGGNQSDGVTITRIAKDRCIAVRRLTRSPDEEGCRWPPHQMLVEIELSFDVIISRAWEAGFYGRAEQRQLEWDGMIGKAQHWFLFHRNWNI